MVNYRYLGNSGLKISEITYGNWLTHGSQIENDHRQGVRARGARRRHHELRHRGRVREHQGGDRARRGPQGPATRVPGDLHEGVLAHRTLRPQRQRSVAQAHSWSRSTARSAVSAPTTWICTKRTGSTSRPRSRRRCRPSPTSSGRAKALYIGVSEWTSEQIRAGHALARELGVQLISSQPQYSMLWRVNRGEVVPTSAELGMSQIVWSPSPREC